MRPLTDGERDIVRAMEADAQPGPTDTPPPLDVDVETCPACGALSHECAGLCLIDEARLTAADLAEMQRYCQEEDARLAAVLAWPDADPPF